MPSAVELLLLNSGPRQQTFNLTAAIPSGWAFTRAGNTATYWNRGTLYTALANVPRFEFAATGVALGYLNEPAATNTYLNSQAPATQTIAVTAQAYTLSFYGTGTIALTGTYTGTLSGTGAGNLVQLTFTPTAGALIATLTGTVTNVQVEAGSFATSRIITGATAVTRNVDNLSVPLSLYPWWQTAGGYSGSISFSSPTATQVGPVVLSWNGAFGVPISVDFYFAALNLDLQTYVGGVYNSRIIGNLATSGSQNTLAFSVVPPSPAATTGGVWASLNRATPVFLANGAAGMPKITTLTIGQASWSLGTNVAAMHALSLTLRAGPSTAAQLRAMH